MVIGYWILGFIWNLLARCLFGGVFGIYNPEVTIVLRVAQGAKFEVDVYDLLQHCRVIRQKSVQRCPAHPQQSGSLGLVSAGLP